MNRKSWLVVLAALVLVAAVAVAAVFVPQKRSLPGDAPALHSPQLRPIGTPGPESPTYRDIDTQMVPPTYRDAVRSYFSH